MSIFSVVVFVVPVSASGASVTVLLFVPEVVEVFDDEFVVVELFVAEVFEEVVFDEAVPEEEAFVFDVVPAVFEFVAFVPAPFFGVYETQ